MGMTLDGKVVLVSGATGGLGRTVAEVFREAGARVHALGRDAGDLTSAEGCRQAVATVLAAEMRLDAVVHLMGGWAGGRLEETSEETWDRMMSLNLRSSFLLFREALPVMRKQGWGRIVAIGSRGGVEAVGGMAAYGVAKAGLHALVRAAAEETKGSGITVNAVLPSVIDTEANRAAMPKADPARWVTPASIGGMLVWLASDASKDVSGALIPMYGGV